MADHELDEKKKATDGTAEDEEVKKQDDPGSDLDATGPDVETSDDGSVKDAESTSIKRQSASTATARSARNSSPSTSQTSRLSMQSVNSKRQSNAHTAVPESPSSDHENDANPASEAVETTTGNTGTALPKVSRDADTLTREDNTSNGHLDTDTDQEDAAQAEVTSRSMSPTIRTSSISTSPPVASPLKSRPALPPRQASVDVQKPVQGFSGTLQTSYPRPPKAPQPSKSASTEKLPAPSRKLTGPFSWLARNTSNDQKARSNSPPSKAAALHGRTDTRTSSITLGSMSTDNGSEKKESLQDRFRLLRMQGETAGSGSTAQAEAANVEQNGTVFFDNASKSDPATLSPKGADRAADSEQAADDGDNDEIPSHRRRPSNVNPRLPPGTVAGVEVGPDSSGPVNWDLWQNVVYEGPVAVARTSELELKAAIASGIPQAIRGVVWQVLADSKQDELEKVYRRLVAQTAARTEGQGSRDKDSVASSASSTRSGQSGQVAVNGTSLDDVEEEKSSPVSCEGSMNGTTSYDLVSRLIRDAQRSSTMDDKAVERLEKIIKRDMGSRTSYSKYLMSAGLQDGLFGICKSYALFDPMVGYAQGMNFIAMPLLFNMPEEEAFSLFVTLMHAPKYRLRTLFTPEMTGLHLLLHQFSRCLEDLDPVLYCHLHRRDVEPHLYATQWFLTLFAYRFPLQLVLRVYDFVLSEGLECAVLRFALTLVEKNREALLSMTDMAQLTTFLKESLFDAYIDKSPSASSLLESGFFGSTGGADKEVYKADVLVSDAVSIDIQPTLLRQYEAEFTEQHRQEKDRETELESLRASVATLTAKVRRLEETSERSDQDHVTIASELVRTKVENEGLKDENEGLKGQVEELRRVVHTQTEEVEKRLRGEMEAVMERNVEIFGENRRLDEELGEMERVLVSTKLDFAQLNSEHDQLKQKWNNVAGLMKEHR